MLISKLTMNLRADQLIDRYVRKGQDGLNQAVSVLKEGLKQNTPEDTGEMVNSYVEDKAILKGATLSAGVHNDAPHAIYVEYGVGGAVYHYHKPKGVVFFSGIGNRTFQRTLEGMKDQLFSIVRAALRG